MVDNELENLLEHHSVWSDRDIQSCREPIHDVDLVSIGGGLGSFAFVDTMLIAGIPRSSVKVLTNLATPYGKYRELARRSQIPTNSRLRSDSASTMGNIWGFPGYALREAASASGLRGRFGPVLNVTTEPLLADFFTPKAGQMYKSVDREAKRIGWEDFLARGTVRAVRKRQEGGYFVAHTPTGSSSNPPHREIYRCKYVHVAIGYPALKLLPDLQDFRDHYPEHHGLVVNAYEPHDQVYERLVQSGGQVLVRGSGIVASRILQRLLDDIEQRGADTRVVHLFRGFVDGPQRNGRWLTRPGGDGVAYQGFNFPKASWGGQLKDRLEDLDDEGRADLIRVLGGTNTAPRKTWREQIKRCRATGHYRAEQGEVLQVKPHGDNMVMTQIRRKDDATLELVADVIIDATGLEGDIEESRLLLDLLTHSDARKNAFGRLSVRPSFEVDGTRSGDGRLYASGMATLGGYYAGVDSFLGLQYAALAITDDLAANSFVGRIGTARSVTEWWRWATNRPPRGQRRRRSGRNGAPS